MRRSQPRINGRLKDLNWRLPCLVLAMKKVTVLGEANNKLEASHDEHADDTMLICFRNSIR